MGRLLSFSLMVLMLLWMPFGLIAQKFTLKDKLPMKDLKLLSLPDGTGFTIEDFNLFKSGGVDQLLSAAGIPEVKDPEELVRKRADSLFNILKEKKTVAVPSEELPLLRHFPGMTTDPKVLANLIFTLNRLGGTRSLEYNVRKGDTISFEYQILRGHGFDEYEVLEGKEVRFTASRNPKRHQITHELVAEADGVLTVNLENKSPLRSKGRLVVSNRPAAPRFSFRYACDTIFDVSRVMVRKQDTIAEVLLSQSVTLSSRRDVTRPSRADLKVSLPGDRQCIGWGYQVGSPADSLQAPLSEYVLTELRRSGMVRLSEYTPAALRLSIRTGRQTILRDPEGRLSRGDGMIPTANPREYFAAFRVDGNKPIERELYLSLDNLSRIYPARANIQVVSVFVDSHEEETEITRKTCREYIMLSYL
jgi:hypothetical protein